MKVKETNRSLFLFFCCKFSERCEKYLDLTFFTLYNHTKKSYFGDENHMCFPDIRCIYIKYLDIFFINKEFLMSPVT